MNRIAIPRLSWQVFYWLNWALILGFWLSSTGLESATSWPLALIALGRLAGLVAGYMILTQFFLIGRNPWLERYFGLDKLARTHQVSGRWGSGILLLHPVLLITGFSGLSGLSWWPQLQSMLANLDYLIWALAGFALLLIVVGISLYIVRSNIKYESWYFVHLVAYAAIFLAFWHQFELGTTINSSTVFYGYWLLLYALVFASHLLFRFVRPLWLWRKHDFRVERLERETPSTVSIYITGRHLDQFPVQPGQFMIFRFLTKKLWWQAHPFSLSMLPDGQKLRITVKQVGDFTGQIPHIPVGTSIIIDGPYGVFTDRFGLSRQVAMLAGGIGITPIRSLSEQMLRSGKDVVIIYSNKTADDIVFKDELSHLTKTYNAKVIHVITQDSSHPGETGRIDRAKLERLVPNLAQREVYLCGPVPMMDNLNDVLQKLGVKSRKIHFERFAF